MTFTTNSNRRLPAVFGTLIMVLAVSAIYCTPALAAKQKHAALVMDANTGRILYNSAGDQLRHPASLTKMMTIYMAFDLIKSGRMNYNTLITISPTAAAQPPSKLGLKPGSKIKLIHAIKALVTKSANDIAVAMAEHIGGTERNFARMMTRKARSLGMKRTVFKNASGLPNDNQVTTARDMLILALSLQDEFPRHYKLFKTRHFSYRGKTYKNHNTLLGRVSGVDGIKTGYIRASGFNLVTSMRQNRKHLVAAVFGGKTARKRNSRMRALLKRYIRRASTKRTRPRRTRNRPLLMAAPLRAKPPVRKPAYAGSSSTQHNTARLVARAKPKTSAPAQRTSRRTYQEPKIKLAKVRLVNVTSPAQARPGQSPSATQPVLKPTFPQTAPYPEAQDTPALRRPPSLYHADGTPRGRPPSTFNDQIANLINANQTQPNQRMAVGANRFDFISSQQNDRTDHFKSAAPEQARTNSRSPYQIQVGAYKTPAEAQRHLATVERKTAGLLKAYHPLTQPVEVGQRTLYRARFSGFQAADSAKRACSELRKLAIDCMVTR